MSRSEKSIAIPTGMIIAALYLVLLIGFSRESYMRRDALARATAVKWPLQEASNRPCQSGQADCGRSAGEGGEWQICPASVEALSRLVGGSVPPLSLQDLQRAFGNEP